MFATTSVSINTTNFQASNDACCMEPAEHPGLENEKSRRTLPEREREREGPSSRWQDDRTAKTLN